MPSPDPSRTSPPTRGLLRVAGVLTQLTCGASLLIGTIGLVLVQQTRAGGTVLVAAWLVAAMAGLVFGGLIYRGGLISMLVAAAIDVAFGVLLIAIEYDTLRQLLRILPASDIGTIGDGLDVAGCLMIGAGALCLIAVPQGLSYARWFRGAAATRSAMSTARGFPPPPVPVRTSTYIIPSEEEPASRRRLYMVLGGLAIGVGAGVGVLVSSTRPPGPASSDDPPGVAAVAPAAGSAAAAPPAPSPAAERASPPAASADPPTAPPASSTRLAADDPPPPPSPTTADPRTAPPAVASPTADPRTAPPAAPTLATDAGATPPASDARATAAGRGDAPTNPTAATIRRTDTIDSFIAARRAAIAKADPKALAGLIAANAFGFGIHADEVAEGRDPVAAQLARDLGEPPDGGFTVESRAISIGEDRGHAWIAEELEVSGPGRDRRRFAITELAAVIDGTWKLVAVHWALPVDDATAERLAVLKLLPVPQPITDRHDGSDELDQAVHAAFASRAAFADARSERPDAFNYGSGGERARGGIAVKRIFTRLKADIGLHDGARVVAGSRWDPAQTTDPWIGYAAVNVDFTSKTRAGTDVTQTFRVLAIMHKDGTGWKIVQTHWSNGGPIR